MLQRHASFNDAIGAATDLAETKGGSFVVVEHGEESDVPCYSVGSFQEVQALKKAHDMLVSQDLVIALQRDFVYFTPRVTITEWGH